ncbi:MAG: amidohydrolase [Pseudobacter sp.]|uniref:amidohydrolase n=1 Tax=Pseudobacter sp. TaxID=2045420 RepID=UPI003F807647
MRIIKALPLLLLTACGASKEKIDLLVHHATIYTVDSSFSTAEALAVKDGKILETGSNEWLLQKYEAVETLDAKGQFIYPGFIDAHAHFFGYGQSLQTADLNGTTSWQAILDTLQSFAKSHPDGWLLGRGWDQNDWENKEFPSNETLNNIFPDRPVLLSRVDGHAAIANAKALELAGVKPGVTLTGGTVEVRNGKLTGILVDNAIDLVNEKVPATSEQQAKQSLLDAQERCFAVGLTTIDDCGLPYSAVELIDQLNKSGELKMRLYVMLSDGKKNFEYLFSKGRIKTDRLHVNGFKVYADGALGSHGACLLHPYSDKPRWSGFLLSDPAHFDSVANILYEKNFQMCTHAIGDSGNRTILNTYAKYLKEQNDRRWRIEHAQVVNKVDFDLFGKYSIIPSVQPTHATSDMYWAEQRLGAERVRGAYAFNDLLKQNGWIPLGTDFPVEDISPFKTFYAAVARKDAKGWPAAGFQMENALSREAAIRGMTIWAAKSNFEEQEKGSLEKGKFADFILLDKDLMKAAEGELLQTQVQRTYINGEKVFQR